MNRRPSIASIASIAFALVLPAFALVLPAFALGVRISPASEVAPAANPDMEAARHLDFENGRCAASPVAPSLARR